MSNKYSCDYKSINRLIGKAIHHYNMISDGDKLAVGLSGGKDSLSLMWALNERKKRILVDFEILAIYIDPGFDNLIADELIKYCKQSGYKLIVQHSNFGVIAHSKENKKNPCFLCSRRRRQLLFETAENTGCNKIVLGHNKDDIIETLFLNLFYSGEISTMVPSQTLFKGKIKIIRPLAYIDENRIRCFAVKKNFPVFVNPCPSSGKTKRQNIKDMLSKIYKIDDKIKGNIFRALSNVKMDYLLK